MGTLKLQCCWFERPFHVAASGRATRAYSRRRSRPIHGFSSTSGPGGGAICRSEALTCSYWVVDVRRLAQAWVALGRAPSSCNEVFRPAPQLLECLPCRFANSHFLRLQRNATWAPRPSQKWPARPSTGSPGLANCLLGKCLPRRAAPARDLSVYRASQGPLAQLRPKATSYP